MAEELVNLSILSLIIAGICFLLIAIDVFKHPQNMWIMQIVWSVTALWSGPLGLYFYYKVGRLSTKQRVQKAKNCGEEPSNKKKPFWQSVAVGATHCGSGCTLGDICAEWFVCFVPIVIFGQHILGTWTADYVLAFIFGIAFQYFTIKPMKELSSREGLLAAIKADTLSLTAWQIGMYGWMAISLFVIFSPEQLKPISPVFWFMMQIAMFFGFLTSYPVNWWLLKINIKEAM